MFFFLVTIFSSKTFGFFGIQLLACFCVIPSQLLIEFSFVILKVLLCLYCFSLCQYLFNLPSFASTFWFISSSCIVIFSRVVLSFLFLHIPAFSFILSFSSVFLGFFSGFPVEFHILVLTFFKSLSGSHFSHKLMLPLRKLVRLTRLYCSLVCEVVLYLFSSFLS